MKQRSVTIPSTFAGSLVCIILMAAGDLFAQGATVTFDVLASFDYPGSTTTSTRGINQNGDISGFYYDSSGANHGYVRLRNGRFIPVDYPNGVNTFALGVNSSRTVVGDYFDVAANVSHGFLLSDGVFTQFDFGGLGSTNILGINDAGDFVGDFYNDTETSGFATIGGNTIIIAVPGGTETVAGGINSTNQIVGWYYDSTFALHGFFRDKSGNFKFPLDYPGADGTVPIGINDQGAVVGYYFSPTGIRAFFIQSPDTVASYEYPGASTTAFTGITNAGLLSGRYEDSSGLHGFVARVKRSLQPQNQ